MAGYFVTGTDTEVGKTVISLGLMQLLQDQGLRVVGMKPVASGCVHTPGGLRNDDALKLQNQSSEMPDYALVNPYAFEPPIAPHIAAREIGVEISPVHIRNVLNKLMCPGDFVVVEGIGGWSVPINAHETMADLVLTLALPVVMVVGLRLGCINHALLTAHAIRYSGNQLLGWVANCSHPGCEQVSQIVEALDSRIDAPLLGVLPHMSSAASDIVAEYLQQGLSGIQHD